MPDHVSLVVKVSDRGWRVMSLSQVPLKTRRVGQRCTLNLLRALTSSRWCGYYPYYLSVCVIVCANGRSNRLVIVVNSWASLLSHGVQISVPEKIRRCNEELMHVKSVEVESPHLVSCRNLERGYQLRCRPRHLTKNQKDEVHYLVSQCA
ncbi:hypothetical protein TNCV_1957631 [Trichonephila clavipes]|nr:hypothetical protein TNCV_1957631 [Trichonephila clavipes]